MTVIATHFLYTYLHCINWFNKMLYLIDYKNLIISAIFQIKKLPYADRFLNKLFYKKSPCLQRLRCSKDI